MIEVSLQVKVFSRNADLQGMSCNSDACTRNWVFLPVDKDLYCCLWLPRTQLKQHVKVVQWVGKCCRRLPGRGPWTSGAVTLACWAVLPIMSLSSRYKAFWSQGILIFVYVLGNNVSWVPSLLSSPPPLCMLQFMETKACLREAVKNYLAVFFC